MSTIVSTHYSIKQFLESKGLSYEKQFFNFIDEYPGDDVPYICKEIAKLLDDNGCYYMISDEYKVNLSQLARVSLDKLFDPDGSKIVLDKVIPYGKIETYKVSAAYGLRPATENEVKNGVEALIPEYVYPAGQETYEMLCLMYWALTGRSWYFRQAGYELSYNKTTGKVENTIVEMVDACILKFIEMLKFVSDYDKYEKAIKIIKKSKRNGFKYADYAKDEIKEEISVKQLVKNIDEKFPRKSENKDFRRAIALVIKTNVKNERLTPMEIAEMRRIYRVFTSDRKNYEKKKVNEATKEQCEIILKNKALLGVDHFVYKIIGTFQKHNYIVQPSEKQQKFIDEALEKIEAEQMKQNTTGIITEDDIDKDLETSEKSVNDTETEKSDSSKTETADNFLFDDIDHMYDILNSGIFETGD